MAMIAEQFKVGEEVCGAVLSIRAEEDILSFWNRTANDIEVKNRIRDTFLRVLNLPKGLGTNIELELPPRYLYIEYKAHNDFDLKVEKTILIQRFVRRFWAAKKEKKVTRKRAFDDFTQVASQSYIFVDYEKKHPAAIMIQNHWKKIRNWNLFILNLAFMFVFAGISNRAIPGLMLDSTRKKSSGQ